MPTPVAKNSHAELSSALRPALLRVTRMLRNQRADQSLTLTHLSALAALRLNGPMSAGELASFEKVQPPSMTKILATLEGRGLVRRDVHPSDRRQAIIALTPQGDSLLDSERRSRDAWLNKRMAVLSDEERAVLAAAIPVLVKLADQQ